MQVAQRDGSCRTCGGQLEVIDADDATMTVTCLNPECGDEYLVEPDAFGDGGVTYYVGFLTEQAEGRQDDSNGDEFDDLEGDSAVDEE